MYKRQPHKEVGGLGQTKKSFFLRREKKDINNI